MSQLSASNIYSVIATDDYIFVHYALQGMLNKNVAQLLHISAGSVGKKCSEIYASPNVRNEADMLELCKTDLTAKELSELCKTDLTGKEPPELCKTDMVGKEMLGLCKTDMTGKEPPGLCKTDLTGKEPPVLCKTDLAGKELPGLCKTDPAEEKTVNHPQAEDLRGSGHRLHKQKIK